MGRKFGELAAGIDEHVGGERAGAAGIGDNSETRPAGAWLFRQHFGHVKQLLDRVHPQYADPAKGGIEHFIAAGERTSV